MGSIELVFKMRWSRFNPKAKRLGFVIFTAGCVLVAGVYFYPNDIERLKISTHGVEIIRGIRNSFGQNLTEVKPISKTADQLRTAKDQEKKTVPAPSMNLKRKGKHKAFAYYFEKHRAQGDSLEDETYLVKRLCVPKFQMPLVCYLDQKTRNKIPIYPAE